MRSSYRFTDAGEISVKSVTALDDGDLLIAGLAADFAEDREKEAFTEDAFRRGLGRFLNGPAALCWMHKQEVVLGKVLTARVVEGVGVEITARVDRQLPSSPYYHVYSGIKKGSISALSFGGYFEKERGPDGVKIVGVDLTELSVCANGVGRQTRFSVIAGKALADNGEQAEAAAKAKAVASIKRDVTKLATEVELSNVQAEIRRVEAERASLRTQATLDAVAAAEDADRARYRHRKALAAAAQPEPAPIIGGSAGYAVVNSRPRLDAAQSAEREASWAKHRDAVEAKYQRACAEAREAGLPEPIRFDRPPFAAPEWWGRPDTVTVTETRPPETTNGVLIAENVHPVTGRPYVEDLTETDLSPEDRFRIASAPEADRSGLTKRILSALMHDPTRPRRDVEPQFASPTTIKYRRDVPQPEWDEESPEQGAHESPQAYFARLERINEQRNIDYSNETRTAA